MMPVSLQELQQFDSQPRRRGREERFFCPLCPDAHDGSDRRGWTKCLSVNTSTGAFYCHRCKVEGYLKEHWHPPLPQRERKRAAARRTFALPDPDPSPDPEKVETLQEKLREARPRPLSGTPGERYLVGRGIPQDEAEVCQVTFTENWAGRPAILFPFLGEQGTLQAVMGRYLDDIKPKTRTFGPRKGAVFAYPRALDVDPLVIVEGPCCVLALSLVDVRAVALGGTDWGDWLIRKAAFRRVLVALDADEQGDRGAEGLTDALTRLGSKPERLRPPAGDWNDLLQEEGPQALRDALRPAWERPTPTIDRAAPSRPSSGPHEALPSGGTAWTPSGGKEHSGEAPGSTSAAFWGTVEALRQVQAEARERAAAFCTAWEEELCE